MTQSHLVPLQAAGPDGSGLRVEFLQVGAQFAHRIVAFDAENSVMPLLESVEAIASTAWPQSPILQSLDTLDLSHSPTAMLLGAAPNGHWSLSVEPREEDGTVQLLFDVACRIKSTPTALTSTYKIAGAVEASGSNSTIKLSCPLGDFFLEALPLDAGSTQPSCQIKVEKQTIQLARELHPTDTPPLTLRWRYQLSTSV